VETADSTYGSDKDGLVCGYLFVPGAPATPIDAAADWLAVPARSPADAFVWLNFSLANAASERWIRRHLSLPESSLESLHEDVGSTRLEQDGDALVAVIHDVLFDFTFDPGSVSTVSLCVEPSFLLSARLRPLRSVDRLRASVKTGQTFRSSAHLLGHLLRDQAEVLVNIVRQSTIRVDFIEDKLLADRISTSRRDLGSLRRTLVRLQRLLAPEPAALFRLLNRPPAWIGGEDVQDLREAARSSRRPCSTRVPWLSGSSSCRRSSPPRSPSRPIGPSSFSPWSRCWLCRSISSPASSG
jgi:zinc transporter